MKTSKPSCTPRSCSVRIISRPVRSPTWQSRLKVWPPNARCRISPLVGAVEERAPLFEFAHAVRRFLRVKLRHAPVVQKLSAAHGVAEMRAPVVRLVHVGHGGGKAAFGHHGVRFAEQRLAHHADLGALRQRLDRGAQARAARADDQYIVFVSFVFGESSQQSDVLIAPVATRRM